MRARNWDEVDFLLITCDAYIDHPSFGHAIISRVLENEGFRVGIIPQPNWKNKNSLNVLGRPKLGVLISSGVIDSMVNNYTATKKTRREDVYSPGGKKGLRPNRAIIIYSNLAREVFKDKPIIIGGIEASLRRFAHYDYWDDFLRRSILFDSKADILVYGMGEKSIVEIANQLKSGKRVEDIHNIRGTSFAVSFSDLPSEFKDSYNSTTNISTNKNYVLLHSYEEISKSKNKYAQSYKIQYDEQDPINGRILIQPYGNRFLVQNPPSQSLTIKEMDKVYSLPYERTYHPSYEPCGGVPALQEVEFSLTSHRGCFGGCSFCALNFHQGRIIQKRSQASIINEAKNLTYLPNFKGYIHDVGGPTANFRNKACLNQEEHGTCKGKQCLYPKPCKNLIVDHSEYLSLLRRLREIPGIKKVFIRSGIRYDYLMLDNDDKFFKELCEHHISGQLKVAPEHVSNAVLSKMGKPGKDMYNNFVKKYSEINNQLKKKQFLVPYLISGHPGSTLNDAIELAEYLRDINFIPEQVQDFYPTPGTLSTCMYYTGIDPRNMKSIYVPKLPKEKAMQRALLQYRRKENYRLILEALILANRKDLIGFNKICLIRPIIKKNNKAK